MHHDSVSATVPIDNPNAADAYKAGGGNLFVVFGEPDIALDDAEDDEREA